MLYVRAPHGGALVPLVGHPHDARPEALNDEVGDLRGRLAGEPARLVPSRQHLLELGRRGDRQLRERLDTGIDTGRMAKGAGAAGGLVVVRLFVSE